MQILQESPVLEHEIDRLGHMNVQYYMERAGRAILELLQSMGVTPEYYQASGATLRHTDIYCRFHREQFAGSVLQVLGGPLDVDVHRARFYIEIRNPKAEQVAATFIIEAAPVTLAERKQITFPAEITEDARLARIGIPDHGGPRTLKLDPPRVDIGLAELDRRVADLGELGMMSGRFEYAVDPELCDDSGYFPEGASLMTGGRRPQTDEDGSYGPPVLVTDEGHRFGWAIMETRAVVLDAMPAGATLCSIGADVAIAAKSRHSRRWTFNKGTGELLGVNDAVAVALDLDERRAIEIPRSIRDAIERNYFPEYA